MPAYRIPAAMIGFAVLVACAGPASPAEPSADPSFEGSPRASGGHGTATPAPESVLTTLSDAPVVEPVGDEQYVNPGAMVVRDEGLVMLANSFTAFPGPSRVDLFTSSDGLGWGSHGADPVLTSEQVPFAEATAFLMTALPGADGSLVGWVYTYNGAAGLGQIGRASAPAPEGPWTVDPTPVLEPGPAGSWDASMVLEPAVVRTDAGYAMYYTGVDESGVRRIGLATSPDGIVWTKSDGPVLEGTQPWDFGSIGEPEVEETGDGWVMVYRSAARRGFGLGMATSSDGETWTSWSGNPILDGTSAPAREFYQAALIEWQDRLLYYLEAGSLGGTSVYPMELIVPDD